MKEKIKLYNRDINQLFDEVNCPYCNESIRLNTDNPSHEFIKFMNAKEDMLEGCKDFNERLNRLLDKHREGLISRADIRREMSPYIPIRP